MLRDIGGIFHRTHNIMFTPGILKHMIFHWLTCCSFLLVFSEEKSYNVFCSWHHFQHDNSKRNTTIIICRLPGSLLVFIYSFLVSLASRRRKKTLFSRQIDLEQRSSNWSLLVLFYWCLPKSIIHKIIYT